MSFDPIPVAKAARLVLDKRVGERIPAPACILIGDGRAVMTDLDSTLTMDAPGADHAPVMVPAAILAKAKAGELVSASADAVTVGKVSVRIKDPISVEDFPRQIVARDYAPGVTLPLGDLRAVLRDVAGAMSTEETRYYLNGVFLHAPGPAGRLVAVATDGHRLMRATAKLPAPDFAPVIVPAAAVKALLGLPFPDDGMVAVCSGKDQPFLSVAGAGWRYDTKGIDGSFPDYTRVYPARDEVKRAWSVSGDALADAVKSAARFAEAKDATARLDFGAGALAVGDATCPVPGEITGAGQLTIGFNSRYVKDMAAVAGEGGMVWRFISAGDPALIEFDRRPTHDLDGVLMPVRLR